MLQKLEITLSSLNPSCTGLRRLTGQKMNPHMARKSAVTHFREGSTDRELESLALCMGHSVAVQRTVYDLRTPVSARRTALYRMRSADASLEARHVDHRV